MKSDTNCQSFAKFDLIDKGMLNTWVARFGHKVAQIAPKWDKSVIFTDQIQYILAYPSDLKKSRNYAIWAKIRPTLGLNLTALFNIFTIKYREISQVVVLWLVVFTKTPLIGSLSISQWPWRCTVRTQVALSGPIY